MEQVGEYVAFGKGTGYNVMIVEKTGNLFDKSHNVILAHACNCMGEWGAGIALEFKKRYFSAYLEYKRICSKDDMRGKCYIIQADKSLNVYIACLFTSYNYGRRKDDPDTILENTRSAVTEMFSFCKNDNLTNLEIRMPKINSNFFNVPWEDTRNAILTLDTNEEWTINVVDKSKKRYIGFAD